MITPRLTVGSLAALAFALAPQGMEAQANQPGPAKSVREGVYTEAQARRGEKLNGDSCAPCHMTDFFTENLLQSWAGATADMLYDLIRTTMPQDQPGGLEPQQYADVMAYIFELNGLPSGQTELEGTKEALAKILIELKS